MSREELNELRPTYNDLRKCIEQAYDDLEIYKNLGMYKNIKYPDKYNNPCHQACYIVRYLYAYAFEYRQMFADLVDMGYETNNINVLSLGCGVAADAWALNDVLMRENSNISACYVGVDNAPWNAEYFPKPLEYVKTTFHKTTAQEYLKHQKEINFDILVFPKSLSDIKSIDNLTEMFAGLKKDVFYLAVSRIKYTNARFNDIVYLSDLKNAINKAGYIVNGRREWKGIHKSIASCWGGITHPVDMQRVEDLSGRKQVLWRDNEFYEVIKYVRR